MYYSSFFSKVRGLLQPNHLILITRLPTVTFLISAFHTSLLSTSSAGYLKENKSGQICLRNSKYRTTSMRLLRGYVYCLYDVLKRPYTRLIFQTLLTTKCMFPSFEKLCSNINTFKSNIQSNSIVVFPVRTKCRSMVLLVIFTGYNFLIIT